MPAIGKLRRSQFYWSNRFLFGIWADYPVYLQNDYIIIYSDDNSDRHRLLLASQDSLHLDLDIAKEYHASISGVVSGDLRVFYCLFHLRRGRISMPRGTSSRLELGLRQVHQGWGLGMALVFELR